MSSNASSIAIFNGQNFSEWKEQVKYHLGTQHSDLCPLQEKPFVLIDLSNATTKAAHDAWERSNRLNLKFIRMTIPANIKSVL